MATAMKIYAEIAARHGVDAMDDDAVDEFFETAVATLPPERQQSILAELLENDGLERQVRPAFLAKPRLDESPTKSILSEAVEIKGIIKFANELIVHGKIEGEISSDGWLTVGESAEIRGEIRTNGVTVFGKVNGNITVVGRCELKARAQLVGDLKASRIVIEEGATFVGKAEVSMNKAAFPLRQATTAAESVKDQEDARDNDKLTIARSLRGR